MIVLSTGGFATGVQAGIGFLHRGANRFVVVNVDPLRGGGHRDQKNQRENKRECKSHWYLLRPGDLAKRGPGRTLTVRPFLISWSQCSIHIERHAHYLEVTDLL
jgi:hypothetical protein